MGLVIGWMEQSGKSIFRMCETVVVALTWLEEVCYSGTAVQALCIDD